MIEAIFLLKVITVLLGIITFLMTVLVVQNTEKR